MERTKMPFLRNGNKGGFEPGLTWLQVRHSATELPRSTYGDDGDDDDDCDGDDDDDCDGDDDGDDDGDEDENCPNTPRFAWLWHLTVLEMC